jgi:hypothetical protein
MQHKTCQAQVLGTYNEEECRFSYTTLSQRMAHEGADCYLISVIQFVDSANLSAKYFQIVLYHHPIGCKLMGFSKPLSNNLQGGLQAALPAPIHNVKKLEFRRGTR